MGAENNLQFFVEINRVILVVITQIHYIQLRGGENCE